MSDIDWSKAPEGTTHYAPAIDGIEAVWCKQNESGSQWLFMNAQWLNGWAADSTVDDHSRYIPRPGVTITPTLETMLTEWRDLEARAKAAQAEADALFKHAGQCHGEIVVRLAELGWGAPRGSMVLGEPAVTLDDSDGWIMEGYAAPADATHFIPETDERKAAWMKCVGSEWWCLVLGDSKWLVDELDDEDQAALISRPSTQP